MTHYALLIQWPMEYIESDVMSLSTVAATPSHLKGHRAIASPVVKPRPSLQQASKIAATPQVSIL